MNRRYGHKRAMREAEENMETFRRFFGGAEQGAAIDVRDFREEPDADDDEIRDEWYGEEGD